MNELTVGSLFSGIGGFDLGFERAGMRTVWFCEQDPFCQRVLAKHWPGVPCYSDVCALVADTGRERGERRRGTGDVARQAGDAEGEGLQRKRRGDAAGDSGAGADGEARSVPVQVPYVDVLCGGFPCQDISLAGKGAGIDGARSGLWSEYARLIGELRPRYVVVENVSALLGRGLGRVLGDLAEIGYDAEWDCLPASAVGAPHRRDRFWLVAYPNGDDGRQGRTGGSAAGGERQPFTERALQVADTDESGRGRRPWELGPGGRREPPNGGWWLAEPDVGRVAHGVPMRVDRLRSLGNALVPQIAQWIGERILMWESGCECDGALVGEPDGFYP